MAEAPLYMSPLVYNYLLKNAAKIPHDKYKSDVFSFGICLLEAGLLRKVQDIYEEENSWINLEKLECYIDEFCMRQFSSTGLGNLLRSCLDSEESSRLDWIALKQQYANDVCVAETYGTYEKS